MTPDELVPEPDIRMRASVSGAPCRSPRTAPRRPRMSQMRLRRTVL
jgi:hypothetical protein